jgi:hydroxyacylglutathione hydrolase
MAHVVTRPREPFLAMGGALEVHQLPSASDNLIWIGVCTATREAFVVDGPTDVEARAWAERRPDVQLKTLLNTHTHSDHVGINHALRTAGELADWRVVGPRGAAADVPGISQPVDEGDTVQVGALTARVMRTEGHLDGHISYVFGDVLFCGDTLFAGGCGYLFDGPAQTMFASLMRLAALDPATWVCCAQEYTEDNLRFAWSVEPDNAALAERIRQVWAIRADGGCTVPSTIAEERASNPFLRPGSPSIRAAVAAAFPDRDLSLHGDVFAATRALKDSRAYKTLTDDQLPLEA